MRFELESVAMRLAWANVPRIDVHERLADAGEDAAIASTFALPVERLAMFRGRPSVRMVTLRDGADTLLGFAPFDSAFPGAATFCAVRPDLAHALVEAMRHYAEPQLDVVIVSVEGNRELADAVLALGAAAMFDLLRLSGPL